MNFPYSSLIVEAESAKQQLTRAFQTEAGGQISNLFQNGIKQSSHKNDWNQVANSLRFFADCAAKKWPLRGSKSNDLRHKNIFGALKASSQGEHEELQLLRRMFICKTCQIR